MPPRLGVGNLNTRSRRYYASAFSTAQTPIAEGSNWVNNGTDWTLVNTSGGVAFGTQVGGSFDDSYAHLTGTWGADYEITATIFKGTTSGIQEVELLFRITDSSHSCTLYEINFAHDGQYVDFVRWPGPLGTSSGDFTFLVPSLTYSVAGGVNNGDRIKGRIEGNVLTAWIDKGFGWVLIGSATDTAGGGGGAVLTSGNPGMGFFKTSGSGAMNQFCYTDYQVTEL